MIFQCSDFLHLAPGMRAVRGRFLFPLLAVLVHVLAGWGAPCVQAGLVVLGEKRVKSGEQLALEAAAGDGSAIAAWRLGVYLATPSANSVPLDPAGAEGWLRRALDGGEKRSLAPLGKLLLETSSRGKDAERVSEGLELLRKASGEDAGASLLLGLLSAGGSFVERDFAAAGTHFAEAARLGDPAGSYRLGWLHSGEAGFPGLENGAVAAGHLETAFDQGSNEAGLLLAKLLREGIRLPRDEAGAFAIVTKAAERKDPEAWHLLGKFHAGGVGVTADSAKALQAYLKAAGVGHAASQNEIGMLYYLGRATEQADPAAAMKWLEEAAAQGYAPAHLNLAVILDRGIGPASPESAASPASPEGRKAMEHLIEAASGNLATAQDLLGAWYRDGRHCPRDLSAAAGWFRRAAESGSLSAMINLAQILEMTPSRPNAKEEALVLYGKAAEKGHAVGHFHSARLLAAGVAGPADLVKSYAHLAASAEAGFQLAQENLPRLQEALSESQIVEAEALRAKLTWVPWVAE